MTEADFVQAGALSRYPTPIIRFDVDIPLPTSFPQGVGQVLVVNAFGLLSTVAPVQGTFVGFVRPQFPIMLNRQQPSTTSYFCVDVSPAKLNELEQLRLKQAQKKDMWFVLQLDVVLVDLQLNRHNLQTYTVRTKPHSFIKISETDWVELLDNLGFKNMRIFELPEETAKEVDSYAKERGISSSDAIYDAVVRARKVKEKS